MNLGRGKRTTLTVAHTFNTGMTITARNLCADNARSRAKKKRKRWEGEGKRGREGGRQAGRQAGSKDEGKRESLRAGEG